MSKLKPSAKKAAKQAKQEAPEAKAPKGLNLSIPSVHAKSPRQKEQLRIQRDFTVGMFLGFPGVGKTHVALQDGLHRLSKGEFEKVLIIRPPVNVNDMGFLPGSLAEKMGPYVALYAGLVNDICGNDTATSVLVAHRRFEVRPTTFEQGKTYKGCFVIVDECANMTWKELDMIIGRIGAGSVLFYCGDKQQCYLKKGDEMTRFITDVERMSSASIFYYNHPDDIVRHDVVGEYIRSREGLPQKGEECAAI